LLVAAWAAHSQHVHLVDGALLVAPCDIERLDMQHRLHSWHPMPQARLPFKSIVAASRNDPYCSLERAKAFADAWGSQWQDCGHAGHINAESNLGNWPEGRALLQSLL
jgi:predicted alpha/beta hydrolase family esterase